MLSSAEKQGIPGSLRPSFDEGSNDRFWGMQEYINKIGGSYQQFLCG